MNHWVSMRNSAVLLSKLLATMAFLLCGSMAWAEADPMAEDFYARLGVSRSVSRDEIKIAYKRLAKKLHPDTHPGIDEKLMKNVVEAYTALEDADKRRAYDFGSSQSSSGRRWEDAFGGARSSAPPSFAQRYHKQWLKTRPIAEGTFHFSFVTLIAYIQSAIEQNIPKEEIKKFIGLAWGSFNKLNHTLSWRVQTTELTMLYMIVKSVDDESDWLTRQMIARYALGRAGNVEDIAVFSVFAHPLDIPLRFLDSCLRFGDWNRREVLRAIVRYANDPAIPVRNFELVNEARKIVGDVRLSAFWNFCRSKIGG